MKTEIKRKAWSGHVRTLIKVQPHTGWGISHNTNNVNMPVLVFSPLSAKRINKELDECLKFYNSDYHLWSQRKTGKPCK